MNRKLFLVAALLFFSLSSYAQVHFGVKGGVNRSQLLLVFEGDIIGKNESAYQPKYRGHVGAFGVLELSDKFLLNAELLYSQEGNKAVHFMTNEQFDLKLNYLNVPLLLGYKPISRVSIMVGPEISYLLSSENVELLTQTIYGSDLAANKVELGIASNLRVQLWKNLKLDLRFTQGLSRAVRENIHDTFYSPTGGIISNHFLTRNYSQNFQCSLAYQLK